MFVILDLFLRIHFYSKTFPFACVVLILKRPAGQLKHLRTCNLIKVDHLDSAHHAAALMGGHNLEKDVSEIRNCGRKGTSSAHCQHLIRSGIKHFVTVQAEQRGRDTG